MNQGQYEGIMGALGKILDRMPVRDIPAAPEPVRPVHAGPCWNGCTRPEHRPVGTPSLRKGSEIAADKRQALAIMRAVLDDWIKGAKENHEACQHRHENRGEECWRTFAPSDIRNMINDAARELGLQPFPLPESPEEDKEP